MARAKYNRLLQYRKNGTISTIVPMLAEGTAVTLHRSHTDYLVTEYGIASLRGKTVRERVKELNRGCTSELQRRA